MDFLILKNDFLFSFLSTIFIFFIFLIVILIKVKASSIIFLNSIFVILFQFLTKSRNLNFLLNFIF